MDMLPQTPPTNITTTESGDANSLAPEQQHEGAGLLSRMSKRGSAYVGGLALLGGGILGGAVLSPWTSKTSNLEPIPATESLDPVNLNEAVAPSVPVETYSRELMDSEPEEGLVIDANHVLTTFQFKDGNQIKIFMDSKFKQEIPSPTSSGLSFAQYTFYLSPSVSLDVVALSKAFDEKKEVGLSASGPLYEMNLPVPFITQEMREAAAAKINAQFKNAGVTPANIALVPFRYIELYASVGGTSRLAAAWPNRLSGQSTIDVPAAQPAILPVRLVGDEESLRRLRDEGRLDVRFFLNGFKVKQNVLHCTLKSIAQSGYMNLLSGDARWEDRYNIRSYSGGLGLDLGFLSAGGSMADGSGSTTRSSLVTRNQTREVTRLATTQMDVGMWREFDDNTDHLQAFREMAADRFLSRMQEVQLTVSDDGKLILGEEIKADIAPDVVSKIEHELKDKTQLKNSKTVTPNKSKTSSTFEFLNDDDIKWGSDSNTIIPKTVRVYQFNRASLSDFASMNGTVAQAEVGGQHFIQRGYVYERIIHGASQQKTEWKRFDFNLRVDSIPHTHGDAELGSDNIEYTFYTGDARMVSGTAGAASVITIPYTFRAYERDADNTTLQLSSEVSVQIPPGLTVLGFRIGERINYSRRVEDEDYDWFQIASAEKRDPINLDPLVLITNPNEMFQFHKALFDPVHRSEWPAFDNLSGRGDGPEDQDNLHAGLQGTGHIEVLVETQQAGADSVTFRDLGR